MEGKNDNKCRQIKCTLKHATAARASSRSVVVANQVNNFWAKAWWADSLVASALWFYPQQALKLGLTQEIRPSGKEAWCVTGKTLSRLDITRFRPGVTSEICSCFFCLSSQPEV